MFKWFTGSKTSEKPSEHPVQPGTPDPQSTLSQPEAILETRPTESPEDTGGLAKLRSALSLTGKSLFGRVRTLVQGEALDEDAIDEIEEALIRADVGLDTATHITDKLRARKHEFRTNDELMDFLRQEFTRILTPFAAANHLDYRPGALNIYLVVGVNGAGKTTFIGKLANRFIRDGKKVVIGAGDTFRAAAGEQLEVWAKRAGAEFVGFSAASEGNSEATFIDPSAVMFDAIQRAKETGADVLLLDTAGRLQNKFNLMEELRKIRRVIDKEKPDGAFVESLLVLDATTGQNALKQAEVFKEAVNINGVVLTKLDGSARGGIVLTIAREYQLPVKMVGVGEGIDDLKTFDTGAFIDGLFEPG